MTRWPEIGSEAFSTDVNDPIFLEMSSSPEIRARDMMEESDKVGDKRTRIIFSNDIGMREDGE